MKNFHHIGIPTSKQRDGETYLEGAKLFITSPDESENRIEWLRFEEGSPLPEVLKTTAHVAYAVEDLDAALEGQSILMEPFEPVEGIRVAFILEDEAPVELMQFSS